MKAWQGLLVVLQFIVIAHGAHAVNQPNLDRPVLGTEMQVQEAQGVYADVQAVELHLTQKQFEQAPSALQLRVDGQIKKLPIVDKRMNHCGTKLMLGEEAVFHIMADKSNAPEATSFPSDIAHVQIEFFDRTLDRCEQPESSSWLAQVSALNGAGEVIGHMVLVGTPEPIYNILPHNHM